MRGERWLVRKRGILPRAGNLRELPALLVNAAVWLIGCAVGILPIAR